MLRISYPTAAAFAVVLTGLAAPAFAAPMGSAQTAQVPVSTAPLSSWQVGFPKMDDGSEPILPRAYRSKCDDLTDAQQQLHCFRTEQDDSFKDSDGVPDNF